MSAGKNETLPIEIERWSRGIKWDIVALWLAARDPRVPWYAKAVCAAIAALPTKWGSVGLIRGL